MVLRTIVRLGFVVVGIWHSLAAGQHASEADDRPIQFSVKSERAGPTSERVTLGYGTCLGTCSDRELMESETEKAWLRHLISVQGKMTIDGSHIREAWEFIEMVLSKKPRRRSPFAYLQAALPLLYSTPDMWNVTWMEDRIMPMWTTGESCFSAGVNLGRMFELIDSPTPPLRAAFVSTLALAHEQSPADVMQSLGVNLQVIPAGPLEFPLVFASLSKSMFRSDPFRPRRPAKSPSVMCSMLTTFSSEAASHTKSFLALRLRTLSRKIRQPPTGSLGF